MPSWPGAESPEERLRIFAKMFALYPASRDQDQRARISAFVEETIDIPAFFLRRSIGFLVGKPRVFAPGLGEIRATAGRAYADIVLRATGEDLLEPPRRGLRSDSLTAATPRLIAAMSDPQAPETLELASKIKPARPLLGGGK